MVDCPGGFATHIEMIDVVSYIHNRYSSVWRCCDRSILRHEPGRRRVAYSLLTNGGFIPTIDHSTRISGA